MSEIFCNFAPQINIDVHIQKNKTITIERNVITGIEGKVFEL